MKICTKDNITKIDSIRESLTKPNSSFLKNENKQKLIDDEMGNKKTDSSMKGKAFNNSKQINQNSIKD